jgi:hypothetical protein
VFREIRGVQQRDRTQRKRWYQDAYFDLFVTESSAGTLQWFQLCYRRDTPWERVLEWKRGRGFLHLKVALPAHAADREEGVLMSDGVMPHDAVLAQFRESGKGLPASLCGFVDEKIREYAHPERRYRRKGARTPPWLMRLRAKL